MQGPPTKNNSFEYWQLYSSREIATFKAMPLPLTGLSPGTGGQGSGYKSSRIELKANSHSLMGIKNLLRISCLDYA